MWQNVCKNIIGIEPSEDMISVANKKANVSIRFVKAFSENTGLPDKCADVVVCSQSFHWLEPRATLAEANRILRDPGIFATVDCDWPPLATWKAEKEYMRLYSKVKKIEANIPEIKETFVRYPKDKHLKNIAESGYFTYSREPLFSNEEICSKERFINLILSQGSLQTILRKRLELIEEDLKNFKSNIERILGNETFKAEFCYRMRIGVKSME